MPADEQIPRFHDSRMVLRELGWAGLGDPFRARRAPPGVALTFALRALVPRGKVSKRREDDGSGRKLPAPSSSRLQTELHGSVHRRPKARPPVEDGFARPCTDPFKLERGRRARSMKLGLPGFLMKLEARTAAMFPMSDGPSRRAIWCGPNS